MKGYVVALSASAALLIASVALGQREKSDPVAYQREQVYEPLSEAPAKMIAKRNPLHKDQQAVEAGRNLFEQHCTECHGKGAEGSKKAPSLRVEEVQNAAPGAIFWVLTNGVVRRGMPVWSKLPELQRWQLVSFIRSLGPSSQTALEKKSP